MQAKSALHRDADHGATMVEYTLTVLLIAIVAIAAIRGVSTQVNAIFFASGGTLTTMSNGPTFGGHTGRP